MHATARQPANRNRTPKLRKTEVQELRAALGHHDVGRLQIAMNDSSLMRGIERFGDLNRRLQSLVWLQGSPLQTLSECVSFQELEHKVIDAVIAPDVEQGADVGMLQRGDGPRFTLKPMFQIRIGERRNLDRDEAAEAVIARLVDFAKAASAHHREDFVRPES